MTKPKRPSAILLAGGILCSALLAAETGLTRVRLNLRECPEASDRCRVTEILPVGTGLEIRQRSGVWLQVVVRDSGKSGWVHGDFVTLTAPPSRAPAEKEADQPPGQGGAAPLGTVPRTILFILAPFLGLLAGILTASGLLTAALALRGEKKMTEVRLRTKLTNPKLYEAPRFSADVVMKGGITSGVVFPLALCELARTYRLRNIGGTSAGAIAAGLAAAAESGRTRGKQGGFAELAEVPAWLGLRKKGSRRSNMLRLFQPPESTRSLFELLLVAIQPGAPLVRVAKGMRYLLLGLGIRPWLGLVPGLLLAAFLALVDPPASLAGFVLAAALWLVAAVFGLALLSLPAPRWRKVLAAIGAGTAVVVIVAGPPMIRELVAPELPVARYAWGQEGALLLAALGLLGGALWALADRLFVGVPENHFGICTGNTEASGDGAEGLTPWLHARIQGLAGRKIEDPPLTFEDLERDEANPIRLRVMTTCLTRGRSYLLPFETKLYYFEPEAFEALFPRQVVNFMVKEAKEWSGSDQPARSDYEVNRFLFPKLPLPLKRLPIVVAVRMSLSFPLLLSACPLWTIDWKREGNQKAGDDWSEWVKENRDVWNAIKKTPEKKLPAGAPQNLPKASICWFSDGGVCSNFPVHLFDRLLPVRPTFAINLKYGEGSKELESRVEIAKSHRSGLRGEWRSLARGEEDPRGSMFEFVGALLSTMQNWADNSMLKVPGYRDRIVHLHLTPDEGGINLDMSPTQIADLSRWGREAGETLVERFTNREAKGKVLSWDNHRWARLRSTLSFLQDEIEEVVKSYRLARQHEWRTYPELLRKAKKEHPTSYGFQAPKRQTRLALETLDTLGKLVDQWNEQAPGFKGEGLPHPVPKLHIRAPLQRE